MGIASVTPLDVGAQADPDVRRTIFFDDDVFVDFGRLNGETDQDFGQIGFDTALNVFAIRSTRSGTGTVRPIAILLGDPLAEAARWSAAGNLLLGETSVTGTERQLNVAGDIRFDPESQGLRFSTTNLREIFFRGLSVADAQVDVGVTLSEVISTQRGAGIVLVGSGTQGGTFPERGVGYRMNNGAHTGVLRIMGDNSHMELRTNTVLPIEVWINNTRRTEWNSAGTEVIFAVSGQPEADATYVLGDNARRWLNVVSNVFLCFETVSDANPSVRIASDATIALGTGGAAGDTRIRRTAASRLTLDNNAAAGADFTPPVDDVGNLGLPTLRFTGLSVTNSTFQRHVFGADQLDSPVNADFAVNALAPTATDSNNAALKVALFDDTTEEGRAFGLTVPANATEMRITFKSRAETAPGATQTVIPKLYNRDAPDNAAVTAWDAGTVMTGLSMPTNENWQYDTQTITLSTLGVTAGNYTQFELTRDAGNASDDLTGDWALLELKVEFL